MTVTRVFAASAAVILIAACIPRHADEVATISLDYITSAQAVALAKPYLSERGEVFSSADVLNSITVRDREHNVSRIQNVIAERDASPQSVSLHFQLVRATEAGSIDPALERVGGALRELLRFKGYSLVAQTMVSGSERRVVEQNITIGSMPLHLAVRINDIVGESGVDLAVDLRRPGVQSLLATNVVIPMGQTVVLGSAYPGSDGEALILTVRGEHGTARLRTSRRSRNDDRHDVHVEVDVDEAVEEAEAAAEAAAEAHAEAEEHAGELLESMKLEAAIGRDANRAIIDAQLKRQEVLVTVPARAGGSEVRVRQKAPVARARSGPVTPPAAPPES